MSSSSLVQLFTVMPWFAWIAIVAIVSGSVSQVIWQRHRHAERMEMIRQGMDPDGGKSSLPEV